MSEGRTATGELYQTQQCSDKMGKKRQSALVARPVVGACSFHHRTRWNLDAGDAPYCVGLCVVGPGVGSGVAGGVGARVGSGVGAGVGRGVGSGGEQLLGTLEHAAMPG